MTWWSHSRRKKALDCPQMYAAHYGVDGRERVKERSTHWGERGTAAHEMLARFIPWAVKQKSLDDAKAVAWLNRQVDAVDDWESTGETWASTAQEAAWLVEAGFDGIVPVVQGFRKASPRKRGVETPFFYSATWERMKPPRGVEPYRWAAPAGVTYGGLIDAWWIEGTRAVAVDWKSGARRPDWSQLMDYALFLALAFPALEEVEAQFVWLKLEGEVDRKTLSREELLAHRATVEEQCRTIEGWTTFPAKGGGYCRFCGVPDCTEREGR